MLAGNETLSRPVHDAEAARLEAHRAFLRLAEGTSELMARHLAYQLDLIDDWAKAGENVAGMNDGPNTVAMSEITARPESAAGVLFDRGQCLQLAVGSLAAVFGPEFAEVDRLPVRVRLPDEPLMLVDRILCIEGTPRSLEGGRIVTEHVVRPEAWYLEHDRVAPSVSIEAGQADLILSGYLGVDFETRGLAMYRLLDATVTFHRRASFGRRRDSLRYPDHPVLPAREDDPLSVPVRCDRGRRAAPVDARWMRRLLHARGSGLRQGDRSRGPAGPDEAAFSATATIVMLIPTSPGRLDEEQVEALRRGDLATAFEAPFDRLTIEDPHHACRAAS